MEISSNLEDDYYEITDNFLEDLGEFNLCSYESTIPHLVIESPKAGLNFNNYLRDNHRDYILTADIKTAIPQEQQINGNYGIILHIPVLQDPGTGISKYDEEGHISSEQQRDSIFNLDRNTIEGNVYNLTSQSHQKLKFSVMENCEYDNTREPSLEIFVEDFYQQEGKPADIFIKNIAVKAISIFSEEDKQGYCLSIVPDTGAYFVDNSSSIKTLSLVLRANGRKTKIENNYDCYQFRKNCNIDTTSENYSQMAGIGWECLNDKTNVTINEDGRETFQQVTNKYSLEVKSNEVCSSLEYKCILIKTSTKIVSSIVLYNTLSNITCSLTSMTGSNSYIKDTGYVSLLATLNQNNMPNNTSIEVVYERKDPSGNNLSIKNFINKKEEYLNNTYTLNTEFPVSDIENINIINCTFNNIKINENGLLEKTILGNATLTLTTDEEAKYNVYIQNGNVFYKYDANGNSPFVGDYAYPTASARRTIDPISFKIYKPDGTEFSEQEYMYCKTVQTIPKKYSMFKNVSSDNGQVTTSDDKETIYIKGTGIVNVRYEINDVQDPKKTKNYMALSISFNDMILNDIVNITFSKEGELGSSGSKYAAVITYNNHGYGELDENMKVQKLQLGYSSRGNGQQYYAKAPGEKVIPADYNTIFNFNVKVYCNEVDDNLESIVDPSKYNVYWSIFDSFNENINPLLECKNNIIKIKQREDKQNGSQTSTIIQARITIGTEEDESQIWGEDVSDDNKKENIYAYYPIEVTYIGEAVAVPENFYLPHITDGYDKVLYASDGTNPQYDSSNPFKFINPLDNLNLDNKNDYTLTWDQTEPNFEGTSHEGQICKIKPRTKFDNGVTLNSIKVNFNINAEQIASIEQEKQKVIDEQNEDNELLNKYILSSNKILGVTAEDNNAAYKKLSNWINNFKNEILNKNSIKTFLIERKKALDILEEILKYSNQIDEYLKKEFKIETYPSDIINDVVPKRKELQGLLSNNFTPFDKIEESNLKAYFRIPSTVSLKKAQKRTLTNQIKILNDFFSKYNTLIKEDGKICVNYESYVNDVLNNFNNLLNILNLEIRYEGNSFYPIGFEDFKDRYNALIIRLTNPIPKYTGTSYQDEQNYIKELYPNEYPLYSTYNDIIKLINNINNLFYRNNLNISYWNNYYTNEITEYQNKVNNLQKDIDDYNKLINAYRNTNITVIKPIPFVLNRYEFANLNGQDGSKLYIDEKEGQYILAPQLGAGIKEDVTDPDTGIVYNNVFTGITLGVEDFSATDKKPLIGMFAFEGGQQTYFLNARDGSAIMGKSGTGQIIIDPSNNKGLLYSSTFQKKIKNDGKPDGYFKTNENGEGMLIDLSTPEIRFGNGNFSVTSDGYLTATGGGSIGGQKISDTQLYSDVKTGAGRVTLDSGTISLNGYPFNDCVVYQDITIDPNDFKYIKYDNKIYEINSITEETDPETQKVTTKIQFNDNTMYVSSEVTKNSIKNNPVIDKYLIAGTNGGSIYSHNHNSLENTYEGFYLSKDGLSIGGNIRITSAEEGKVLVGRLNSSRHQTISGDNSDSYIAYGTTKKGFSVDGNIITFNNDAQDNQVYIGTSGIRLGNKFAVDDKGNAIAKYITASGGSIGNQIINNKGKIIGQTSSNDENIVLDAGGSIKAGKPNADGTISEPTQSIERGGDAIFKNIKCESVQTFGKDDNTQSSTGGFNFNNGSLGGNGVTTADGFAFGSGTIGLTADSSAGTAKDDKITFTPSEGLVIKGDITARNGTFTGTVHANAGDIGGQKITETALEQQQEDAKGGSLDNDGNAFLADITCSDAIIGEYSAQTKLSSILLDFNTRITALENEVFG